MALTITHLTDKRCYAPCRMSGDCPAGYRRLANGTVSYRCLARPPPSCRSWKDRCIARHRSAGALRSPRGERGSVAGDAVWRSRQRRTCQADPWHPHAWPATDNGSRHPATPSLTSADDCDSTAYETPIPAGRCGWQVAMIVIARSRQYQRLPPLRVGNGEDSISLPGQPGRASHHRSIRVAVGDTPLERHHQLTGLIATNHDRRSSKCNITAQAAVSNASTRSSIASASALDCWSFALLIAGSSACACARAPVAR